PVAPTPGGSTTPNPGAPTPGGSATPNPGVPTPEGTPDRNPVVLNPGGESGTIPGAPILVNTTQPVNPSEISIAVNEHLNGELPKTGTATDHLSILLGSGILLSLYVGKRKEEES
uniref:LPXTG cell wall anchor domain-containing protein n=1 Tax=uncultured Streptococcus sp. TaxID=83427 RepID=UPI0028D3A05B